MKYFIMLLAIVMFFGLGSRACPPKFCTKTGRLCQSDNDCCSKKCNPILSKMGNCAPGGNPPGTQDITDNVGWQTSAGKRPAGKRPAGKRRLATSAGKRRLANVGWQTSAGKRPTGKRRQANVPQANVGWQTSAGKRPTGKRRQANVPQANVGWQTSAGKRQLANFPQANVPKNGVYIRKLKYRIMESVYKSKGQYSRIGQWRVMISLGREKRVSPVDVEAVNGNPVWDTAATFNLPTKHRDVSEPDDRLRIRILCRGTAVGQVSLRIAQLAVGITNAEERHEILEPIRRVGGGGSRPPGAVFYKCWLHWESEMQQQQPPPSRCLSTPQLNVLAIDSGPSMFKSLRRKICQSNNNNKRKQTTSQVTSARWMSMADLGREAAHQDPAATVYADNVEDVDAQCRRLSRDLGELCRRPRPLTVEATTEGATALADQEDHGSRAPCTPPTLSSLSQPPRTPHHREFRPDSMVESYSAVELDADEGEAASKSGKNMKGILGTRKSRQSVTFKYLLLL
uniref:C2 domain-containing protein n=1 Tax=Macrostomum lignano TaxID=282301 RepID=A0A1I8H9W7_9PLAT